MTLTLFAQEHQTDPKRMLKDVLALYCLTYGIHPIEAVKAIRHDVGEVEVIPAKPLVTWPDVTPRSDIPANSAEARIRSAAWHAAEHHREIRVDTARTTSDPIGYENAQTWNQSDWDAAAAEYERLKAHPFVGIGQCPVCDHAGEDCTGTRRMELRHIAADDWLARVEWSAKEPVNGRRRTSRYRVTFNPYFYQDVDRKADSFASEDAATTYAEGFSNPGTGGVQWTGDTVRILR